MGPSDRMEALYPKSAEDMLVATSLPAPRRAQLGRIGRNNRTFKEFYASRSIIAEIDVSGGENIAFIDKELPHARYDLMFIVTDDDIKCAPSELSDSALSAIFGSIPKFVDYTAEPAVRQRFDLGGCELTFGFNYDRDTIDRDNGQFFDKRFHLHFNCWAREDIAAARLVRFGDLPSLRERKSMIDPISFLGARVFHDALLASEFDRYSHEALLLRHDPCRDARENLPVGLKIKFPEWSYLATPYARALIRLLHDIAERTYVDLHVAFTGVGPAGKAWYRAPLLDVPEVAKRLTMIPYLSPESRAELLILRQSLKDADSTHLARCSHDLDLASKTLALAGLDYHLGLFSPIGTDHVYLYVQFKMFSRIGGGPAVAGASAVRVDRAGGPLFSDAQLAERRSFQQGFVQRCFPELAPD